MAVQNLSRSSARTPSLERFTECSDASAHLFGQLSRVTVPTTRQGPLAILDVALGGPENSNPRRIRSLRDCALRFCPSCYAPGLVFNLHLYSIEYALGVFDGKDDSTGRLLGGECGPKCVLFPQAYLAGGSRRKRLRFLELRWSRRPLARSQSQPRWLVYRVPPCTPLGLT